MNRPPAEFTPLAAEILRPFITAVFAQNGMSAEQAALLADLLVANDLRGVFSHGTQQAPHYIGHFQEGRLTPAAEITTVSETPTTLVLDGGGGLGYFPCHEAVTRLIAKAQESHIAVATTRNHGHFGAAGIYARIPLPHGLFCYVTSGHQLNLQPDVFVMGAAGGSPMAFGIPCGEEPDFVLDFGAIHDMYGGPEQVRQIMELAPSTVMRSFGLGCACQALGGLMCGVPLDPERAQRQWDGANQGSFMIVVDIEALFPLETFQREMDEYAQKVRQMSPFSGRDKALLPGAIEWERVQRFSEAGIPISARHAESLRKLAADHGLASPV
ncbi:MAG TPA: Ldh family oxidoreductase [Chthonomonadaceae bacterium]|nr:Ldh family oxidoreductase [Chthonomonadaceae bacterium]